MPCDSRITTKLKNVEHVVEAARQLGLNVTQYDSALEIQVGGLRLNRWRVEDAFSASGDTSQLLTLSKKYAEVGVRAYAKKRGFAVTNFTEQDGQVQLTLVKRS